MNASRYFRGRSVVVPNPRFEPAAFAEEVIALASRTNASGIIPVSDAALGVLNDARARIPEHARFMAPSSAAINNVLDKDANLRLAEQLEIPYPTTIDVESAGEIPAAARELGYPVVLKRLSQQELIPEAVSDFTAEIVQDEETLRRIADRLGEYGIVPQVQKFVHGDSFNICCFAARGEIVAAQEYLSFRSAKHVAVARKIVDVGRDRLEYSRRILKALDWEGVALVSFYVSPDGSNTWYLETNGRFWASVQGAINAGWDFPKWTARYFLDGEVPCPGPTGARVTCYHTEDLRVLLSYLRGGPCPVNVGEPGALASIWAYLRAFGPGYQSDVFDWKDPRPAIVDHAALLRGGLRKLIPGAARA